MTSRKATDDGILPGGTVCAIYTRISKDKEVDGKREGKGVDRQKEDCLELARQLGWTVAGVFPENDTSASTRSRAPRPEYESMMRAAEAGEFSAILAYSTSRLTRRPLEYERLINLVERRGTMIRTVVSGKVDLSTADGRMVARILAAADAAEAERTAEREARTFLQNAEEGEHHGARPFGYRKLGSGIKGDPNNGRLQMIEAEAELIRDAANRLIAGASDLAWQAAIASNTPNLNTLRQIMLEWREKGVHYVNEKELREGKRREGAYWSSQNIARMLLNPRQIGMRRHAPIEKYGRGNQDYTQGDFYPGGWEPILDRATWESLCEVLKDPTRRLNGGVVRRQNLLAGFVFCGRCGTKMVIRTGKRRIGQAKRVKRYSCPVDVEGACTAMSRQAAALEEHLRNVVFHWLDTGAYENAVLAVSKDTEIHALIEQREKLEQALAEVDKDYADRVITGVEMRTAKNRIKEQLDPLARDLARRLGAQTLPDVPQRGRNLVAAWESWDLGRRRSLIALMIERVTVNPTRSGRRSFNPADIEITPGSWAEGVELPPMPMVPLRPDVLPSRYRSQIEAYFLERPGQDIPARQVLADLDQGDNAIKILRGLAERGFLTRTQLVHERGKPTVYRLAA